MVNVVNKMTSAFYEILDSVEYKEELFVAETQSRLETMLIDKGMSRAELARQLGVTRARVSQIFSDEAKDFTLRLLLRTFLALDEEPIVLARSEYEALQAVAHAAKTNQTPVGSASVDGLKAELVAHLLQASLGDRQMETERSRKSPSSDWIARGSNIVPFQRTAHG
jgi:DNA-binding Xre family transcriptional regulator